MKTNRQLLLVATIGALVLLVVPALALASVWKDKGVKVTKFTELSLTGGELFEVPGTGGMSCEVKAIMTTEGGSTAKITKWQIKACPTGFEKFTGCEVVTAEAKGLPWSVDVNTEDLTITSMRIKRTFKNCGTTELDKTITATVTLESPKAISEMEFSGETTGYKDVGSLTVEGTNNGTYEIG